MPKCRLLTSETEDLKSFGQPVLPDRFPDEVVALEVDSFYLRPKASHHDISYENLTILMVNTHKRLEKIEIPTSDRSPEFLRFVSVACEKTKSLILRESIQSPDLCDCLNTRLSECGIDELSVNLFELSPPHLHTALPIFQGIAQSSSLKKLTVSMQSHHVLGSFLIRALEENQTLESLCVEFYSPRDRSQNDNRMMQNIFLVTLRSTQVRELTLEGQLVWNREEALQILDYQVFMDFLCNPTCVIEKIHLTGIKLQRESGPANSLEAGVNEADDLFINCLQAVQRSLEGVRTLGSARFDDNTEVLGRQLMSHLKHMTRKYLFAVDELLQIKQGSIPATASVKELHLTHAELSSLQAKQGSIPATTSNNTSVKELHLTHAELSSLQLRKILPRFKSLTELDLEYNHLWDVLPLQNLLLESHSSLETLCLEGNYIDEDDIGPFLTELSSMDSLKSLDLSRNPCVFFGKFLNNAGIAAVENAALQNNKIETLRYCHVEDDYEREVYYDSDDEEYVLAEITELQSQYDKKKIKAHLSINRGGRAYLQKGTSTLPSGIWPLILERASKLKYCGFNGSMTATDTRNDPIFWLLREKVFTGSS